jgi:hypothetical protein
MKLFKIIWEKLNYKKRTIALLYWSVLVPSMVVIWPDGFPEGFPLAFYKGVTIFGFLLSALGLGHAAMKVKVANNQAKQVNNNETSK